MMRLIPKTYRDVARTLSRALADHTVDLTQSSPDRPRLILPKPSDPSSVIKRIVRRLAAFHWQ